MRRLAILATVALLALAGCSQEATDEADAEAPTNQAAAEAPNELAAEAPNELAAEAPNELAAEAPTEQAAAVSNDVNDTDSDKLPQQVTSSSGIRKIVENYAPNSINSMFPRITWNNVGTVHTCRTLSRIKLNDNGFSIFAGSIPIQLQEFSIARVVAGTIFVFQNGTMMDNSKDYLEVIRLKGFPKSQDFFRTNFYSHDNTINFNQIGEIEFNITSDYYDAEYAAREIVGKTHTSIYSIRGLLNSDTAADIESGRRVRVMDRPLNIAATGQVDGEWDHFIATCRITFKQD